MIQSDVEYQVAMVQLDRFREALEYWRSAERPEEQHPMIHQAFGDALGSQVESLTEETTAWDDYVRDVAEMSKIEREAKNNARR